MFSFKVQRSWLITHLVNVKTEVNDNSFNRSVSDHDSVKNEDSDEDTMAEEVNLPADVMDSIPFDNKMDESASFPSTTRISEYF